MLHHVKLYIANQITLYYDICTLSNPNHYPSKKPIWAIALSASLSLASVGIGVQGGGADSLKSHASKTAQPDYCTPASNSNNLRVGASVNVLANIVAKIRRGQPVEVMPRPVALTERGLTPGKGLPIVFSVRGVECFGFTLDSAELQLPQITPYKDVQEFYSIIPEPAGDKHIPLVEATQVSGELGVIATSSGLIAGWSETKYSNSDCTFTSCPEPTPQRL